MPKIVFWLHYYLALGLKSNVGVNVTGKVMGQSQRSRSNFWRAAVNIRSSALPSAAKSVRSHYQSNMFVCL